MSYIGIYSCTLEMPWVSSLKEKRSVVKPITERLKARFPVSVARLAGQDSHDWEQIGITTIHLEAAWVHEILGKVSDFIARETDAVVRFEQLEVILLSDLLELDER